MFRSFEGDTEMNASFWDIAGGEEFQIDQTDGTRKEEEVTAQAMFDQFDAAAAKAPQAPQPHAHQEQAHQ